MVIGTLARILRLASLAICLIAVAWFVTFAVEKTSSAAAHQAAETYGNASPQSQASTQAGSGTPGKSGGLQGTLNSAFKTLSSPFSGVTSGSSSEWKIHIVDTLLALLVYGLGLGFLARMLRMAG